MSEIVIECWHPKCPTPKFTYKTKIPITNVARIALLEKVNYLTRSYMEKFIPKSDELERILQDEESPIFNLKDQEEFELKGLDSYLKEKLGADVDIKIQTTKFRTAVCPSGHINKIPS